MTRNFSFGVFINDLKDYYVVDIGSLDKQKYKEYSVTLNLKEIGRMGLQVIDLKEGTPDSSV